LISLHHIVPRGQPAGSPGAPQSLPLRGANRGNNRNKVFFAQQTRRKYLELLRQYAQDWNVTILAYCLMTNHIHLLAKPHQLNALSKMMQGVSQAYSKYVNILNQPWAKFSDCPNPGLGQRKGNSCGR